MCPSIILAFVQVMTMGKTDKLNQTKADHETQQPKDRDSAQQFRRMSVICKVADSCLALKGVEVVGDPAQGSYGDVYKGRLRGEAVAAKVFRVHEESDVGGFAR